MTFAWNDEEIWDDLVGKSSTEVAGKLFSRAKKHPLVRYLGLDRTGLRRFEKYRDWQERTTWIEPRTGLTAWRKGGRAWSRAVDGDLDAKMLIVRPHRSSKHDGRGANWGMIALTAAAASTCASMRIAKNLAALLLDGPWYRTISPSAMFPSKRLANRFCGFCLRASIPSSWTNCVMSLSGGPGLDLARAGALAWKGNLIPGGREGKGASPQRWRHLHGQTEY